MNQQTLPKLEGEIYISRLFKWDLEHKTFHAYFSDVRACLRELSNEDMVLGFGIRSYKTGSIVYFSLVDKELDDAGLTVAWLFTSDNDYNPDSAGGLTARIVNDSTPNQVYF